MKKNNSFTAVDYHGYTGEITCLYNFEGGRIKKTNEYANWYHNFPIYELPTREEWEMCDVDFNKALAIDALFVSVEGARAIDMMDGLTQLLKDLLDIPQGVVRRSACEIVGSCEDMEDGRIIFTIYNI